MQSELPSVTQGTQKVQYESVAIRQAFEQGYQHKVTDIDSDMQSSSMFLQDSGAAVNSHARVGSKFNSHARGGDGQFDSHERAAALTINS